MTDPGISLAVQTPQPTSTIDQVSKAIALRDMISQNALRQQQVLQSQVQTQDLQAQAQQRQRDLSDQKTMQDALLAHKDDGDQTWTNAFKDIQGKVSPTYYNSVVKSHNETALAGLNLTEAQKKDQRDTLTRVDDILTPFTVKGANELDDSQKPTEYQNAVQRLSADPIMGPKIQPLIANGTIPKHYDPQALAGIHAQVVGQKGLLDEEDKRQLAAQEKERANLAAQDAQNKVLERPGIEAESQQKVAKTPVVQALSAAQLADPNLLTPEERIQQQQFERQQATRAGTLAVEQGRLALDKLKTQAEYGPETAQSWVDALKKNPDVEKEIPATIRGKVSSMFQQQTGLPMPAGAPATSQATELAARNAVDNANWIREEVKDPEIQKRLGPILGRLGQFEQNLGTATAGLSPEAAQKAQELRTRMRYFVFQEGRSVLGGRLPQNLMKQLEQSSADVHMDEPTLSGSLDGATKAALTNMDNVDRERFGGQARPRVLRGLPPGDVRPNPNGTGRIASDDGGKTVYDPDTGNVIPR